MTNRIHLGAIVEREGRILLIRQTPRSPWELPGAELQARQTDADEAMAEALETFGIIMTEPEERFLETLYLPDGDGQLIYNLYGAVDWSGEPEIPIGMGAGWYSFDELEAISMQDEVRTAVLVAYGLKDAPDADARILQAMTGAASNAEAVQPSLGALPPLRAFPGEAPPPTETTDVLSTAETAEPVGAAPEVFAEQSPFARPPGFAQAPEGTQDDAEDADKLVTVAEALDIPEAAAEVLPGDIEDEGFDDEDDSISTLAQVADLISQEPRRTAPALELDLDAAAVAPSIRSTRRERGLDVLGTLGNTTDVAGRLAGLRKSYPELADDVVDFAMGDVWSGAALTRRERSLLVVAMLAAMGGRAGPLASHLNGALNHGATPDELVETLRMVAVYAGFPAALEAWKLMETTFANRDEYPSGRQE